MTPTTANRTRHPYRLQLPAIAVTMLSVLLLLAPGCSFVLGRQRYVLGPQSTQNARNTPSTQSTQNTRNTPETRQTDTSKYDAGGEVQRAFIREVNGRSRVLSMLYNLSQPGFDREQHFSELAQRGSKVALGLGSLDWLPSLLARCPYYLKHPVVDGEPWLQTRTVCDLARRANELLDGYYRAALTKSLTRDIARYDRLTTQIRQGQEISGSQLDKLLYKNGALDQCPSYFAQLFEYVQKSCPTSLLAPLRSAREGLANALQVAGTSFRPRRLGGVSGSLRVAVRDRVERDGRLLAAGLTSGWTIERNRWGLYESRYKRGLVIVKRPNESFCREHGFLASQRYLGGLRWSREYHVGLRDALRITRCR